MHQLHHSNEAHEEITDKFQESLVPFSFFSDEKVFTVAAQDNHPNDCLYTPQEIKKHENSADHLLHTRPTFTKSVMVSVAVSKLVCTKLIFVEPGVKVDGAY